MESTEVMKRINREIGQSINEESFKDYLRIVTKQEKDVSLKQAFEDESIHVR